MNTNTIEMAAKIPSGFGMPVCGHLPQMSANPASTQTILGLGTTSVVLDRQAVIKGDMGFAGYAPGTSAWRPPSS